MKIIIIFFVVVLGGGALFLYSKDTDNIQPQNDEAKKEIGSINELGAVIANAGSYELYSPEKIARAESGKVVLFFRASWCPTCRALNANIEKNLANIPEGVSILDVNYDDSTLLKQKYGVTYQHTLVQVDGGGNQIAKWSNSPTLGELLKNIK